MDKGPAPLKLTAEQIDAAKSPKGGWTRATLAQWGVPWPPPSGWRKALIAGAAIGEVVPQTDRPQGRFSDMPETDARAVLHTLVLTVINHGHGHILDEVEGLRPFFGGALPTVGDFLGGRRRYDITGEIKLEDRVYRFWCSRPASGHS